MILPDVNVLIYAFRKDVSQHALCRAWLTSVVMSDARFGLSPLVLGVNRRSNLTPDRRPILTPSGDGFWW